jgi:hypothetical protein
MKRKRRSSKVRTRRFRVWTQPQVREALPYITSIVRSLREHYLEARSLDVRVRKLRERPGHLDRAAILDLEEAKRSLEAAEERFEEAGRELLRLNIYCLDPLQGLALVPFAHEEEQRLAWFVFDLFAPEKLGSWRYHDDPLEMRRPLSEAPREPPSPTLLV